MIWQWWWLAYLAQRAAIDAAAEEPGETAGEAIGLLLVLTKAE